MQSAFGPAQVSYRFWYCDHTHIAYGYIVEFFEAPAFTRHVREYLDDTDLLALQLFLIEQPEIGSWQ
jgi:hypothetical protein